MAAARRSRGFAALAVPPPDDAELTPYEKERAEQLRRNAERMLALDLPAAAARLAPAEKAPGPARKGVSRRKREARVEWGMGGGGGVWQSAFWGSCVGGPLAWGWRGHAEQRPARPRAAARFPCLRPPVTTPRSSQNPSRPTSAPAGSPAACRERRPRGTSWWTSGLGGAV